MIPLSANHNPINTNIHKTKENKTCSDIVLSQSRIHLCTPM